MTRFPSRYLALVPRMVVAALSLLITAASTVSTAIPTVGKQPDGTVIVPTNQILRPVGQTTALGQRPVDMALRPDGKQLAVMTTSLMFLMDTATGKVTQHFDEAGRSAAGLAYSPDGTHLYYAKGKDHQIAEAALDANGTAAVETNMDTGDNSWPSGLSVSPDGQRLYVALFGKNQMGVINLATHRLIRSLPVGSSPFGSYVSPDGKFVYTSNWGGGLPGAGDPVDPIFPVKINPRTGATAEGTLSVYDVTAQHMLPEIRVGLHPTVITFDRRSTRLYVANSNEDTVSVIDISPTHAANPELERIPVRPVDGLPFGSMPNGLALSADDSLLYVANGGNNAVAVITLDKRARPADSSTDGPAKTLLKGFIPTEWFPIGVVLSPDNRRLYVADNKGEGSLNTSADHSAKSVLDVTGSISIIPLPTDTELADDTAQVDANSQYMASLNDMLQAPRPGQPPVPIPERLGEPSLFKHVIYIIKENRTYDQILGDMEKGNGDPGLTEFPRAVTPNHHALAERFGLLDNYYASAVNSADGHQWTDEAIANVFAERVYGNYPSNNPRGVTAYGSSSLDLPPDSLWSDALQHQVSLRNYGEDAADGGVIIKEKQADRSYKPVNATWLDLYRNWQNRGDQYVIESTAVTPPLLQTEDRLYPGFHYSVPDQIRADEWQREFDEYVKNDNLPQLSVLWLPNDHTSGTRSGAPTPAAQVADNDLALGRIVDYLSHSAYWKDTVIFVTEDDAQDGTDHVDGHRTVCLVISAYSRSGQVIHTLYNQTSVVRTIEQILGLPPMNQFDLTAALMSDLFTNAPDEPPYTALPNQIPLDQMNAQPGSLQGTARADAVRSNQMDFRVPDANDEDALNRIIWRATMGNRPYPVFDWQHWQHDESLDGTVPPVFTLFSAWKP